MTLSEWYHVPIASDGGRLMTALLLRQGSFKRPAITQALAEASRGQPETGRPVVLCLRHAVHRVPGLQSLQWMRVVMALRAEPLDILARIVQCISVNVMAMHLFRDGRRAGASLASFWRTWVQTMSALSSSIRRGAIPLPRIVVLAIAPIRCRLTAKLATAQTTCSFCASAEHAGFSQVIDQRLLV